MSPAEVPDALCIEPECSGMRKAHGLCQMHYKRVRAHGTTAPTRATPKRYASVEDALTDRSIPNGSCIQWSGPKNPEGYGRLSHGGVTLQAHRAAYEAVHGPLDGGALLDHTCHTAASARGECSGGPSCPHRSCVNPEHLEPVTALENTMRSSTAPAAMNATKTECIHGHPFDLENTHTDREGKRHCRACGRTRDRKRRAKKAATR